MVSREEVNAYMEQFVDSMEAPEDKDKAVAYMKEFVDSMESSKENTEAYLTNLINEMTATTPEELEAERLRGVINDIATPSDKK